jgi:hypothetical protein
MLRFFITNGYLGFNPGLLQLHRSGLFLADRQKQDLSHSVVTYKNRFLNKTHQKKPPKHFNFGG